MRYQLVVQIKPARSDDFNRLMDWEDALIEHLVTSAEVDDHEWGSGELNVFISTDDPSLTLRTIQGLPETSPLSPMMTAAFRSIDREDYTVLWPPASKRFKSAKFPVGHQVCDPNAAVKVV